MVNYKVTHKYRDCTVLIVPEEDFIEVTISDDLFDNIVLHREVLCKDSPLKTIQVLTESELLIDRYLENFENWGKNK